MKKKALLVTMLMAILLASCVVKSLKPFYTKDTLAYDVSLLGEWIDNEGDSWVVTSMNEELKRGSGEKEVEAKDVEKALGKINGKYDSLKIDAKVTVKKNYDFYEDRGLQEIYENAYFVKYNQEKKTEAGFVVVPFKVEGQLFLDFSPMELGDAECVGNLLGMHYVGIHTLVKVDRVGGELHFSWFAEDKIEKLFDEGKIRIAHEVTGVYQEDYLLTASSEELQKFIAKYIGSIDEDKWKTDVRFTLKPKK